MTSILLVIIYLAFISLGLPDSILGSAWPSMYGQFDVPISYAGMVSMIISAGTIVSSLFSDRIIRKLNTGIVTIISVSLTAIALVGFSFSTSFWMLCIWAIPYGLGAGSVDAALNNFVALHYKSRHMSWLHCFWGIGATVGPYIMGLCLTNGLTWNSGYQTIGIIQVVLVAALLFSLPLWKAKQAGSEEHHATQTQLTLLQTTKLPGAKAILFAFFCYCAVESTTGLWASSYLVIHKGLSPQTAATWAALFYLGITIGRFVCGFISDQLGTKVMIRIGLVFMGLGVVLLLIPIGTTFALFGFISIGIGGAPIFPSLLHQTPVNFGADKSQAIMGMQMACAYVGASLMPPVFGFLSDLVGIHLLPVYLIGFIVVMLLMTERMNRIREKRLTSSK